MPVRFCKISQRAVRTALSANHRSWNAALSVASTIEALSVALTKNALSIAFTNFNEAHVLLAVHQGGMGKPE